MARSVGLRICSRGYANNASYLLAPPLQHWCSDQDPIQAMRCMVNECILCMCVSTLYVLGKHYMTSGRKPFERLTIPMGQVCTKHTSKYGIALGSLDSLIVRILVS